MVNTKTKQLNAYKLLRVRKNGSLGPLFINRRQIIPIGKWLTAENHPTKGYAVRPGWHVTEKPVAPHLTERGRKWYHVVITDFVEVVRPESQGGKWFIAKRIKVIEPIKASD